MTWQTYRLGDVLTLKRGHDLPEAQRQDGEVPVVSSSGITGYHNESKAKAPGVVTGRYGTLGEVFYLEQDYWPLNTALYVTDFKGNHPRFIAYLLQSILRNHQSDKAAVPGVNRNVLHDLKVRSTDLMSQERIADILAAYDDLIENNRRRMTLLEEAARQLYREWFVRLRFPGYEHTRWPDCDGLACRAAWRHHDQNRQRSDPSWWTVSLSEARHHPDS
jgi:type I restriction enzyme S subunit